ncbi:hypothetical protein GCM10010172_78700 [Paractinoplanes ferrugineus]|uniref:Uncharacterized protein n=1 Tax=Paractinoplanes ferrugineus TaxID=113564 RepID=A0A919J4P3_9ACTN|nr:hypothetical protein [Actinoplanes ferrugineus]GIE12943.1 hypothetical protein Afe05nite_47830 [Actinoplanes ferrugineus]
MFFLILFGVVVLAVLALAAWTWPGLEQEVEQAAAAARLGVPRSGREPRSDRRPEPKPLLSLEGVLVAQRVAGEITADQYRRAVEGLAARDEDRHPMAVPPENGTADA